MPPEVPALRKRDPRYDPDAFSNRDYANLVAGYFRRMPADYRIARPSGTKDWLIILTTAGAGVIRRGARAFSVRPHQIVLFKPSLPHDYGTAPEVGHWGLIWAHFHPPVAGCLSCVGPSWLPESFPSICCAAAKSAGKSSMDSRKCIAVPRRSFPGGNGLP